LISARQAALHRLGVNFFRVRFFALFDSTHGTGLHGVEDVEHRNAGEKLKGVLRRLTGPDR
jgi:hypothetical protein